MPTRGRGAIADIVDNGWLTFAVSAVVLVSLAAVTILASMPSTTFWERDGGIARVVSNKLLPQAWGFFTKEPGSDNATAYTISEAGFRNIDAGPQSDPHNLFGLSRSQRAQGTEVAILSSAVPKENWANCEGQSEAQCLTKGEGAPASSVKNGYVSPTVCGNVAIVISSVTPWVYRENSVAGEEFAFNSVAHLNVDCVQS